ncbi:MAG TPA: hypothetical protein VEI57_04355 [Nitrospirota bacterium]|nr:hypothetical protein [Nitrospirota bacterium]
MYITHAAVGHKALATTVENSICPYQNVHSMDCSASIMRMRIDQRRNMTYCLTEDFDRYPVFLATVLRGN